MSRRNVLWELLAPISGVVMSGLWVKTQEAFVWTVKPVYFLYKLETTSLDLF